MTVNDNETMEKRALQFVVDFIKYYEKEDIKDFFDKAKNKMLTSPGVLALVAEARDILPARVEDGRLEVAKLSTEDLDKAITLSENVIDTREMFGRKVQANGSARGLLEKVLAGDEAAILQATEFVKAERGEKEFEVPPKT